MSFLERVSDQLNLRWAWDKVRNASIPGDIWIDETDLAAFELDLEKNLASIGANLRKGVYHVKPLRPMAFPKGPKPDGKPQVRQYFHFKIADQVAWVAVTNELAQFVDGRMPPWSYGNRRNRSIWIDVDEGGRRHRRIGRYRHSSGRIYLPFQRSWPIFRRHVYLTIRAMNDSESVEELSQEDEEELQFQESLQGEQRCPFVRRQYWQGATQSPPAELYWCSIDLEKFYPSMKLENVLENILESLREEDRHEAGQLLKSMLIFPLDTTGWTRADLVKLGIRKGQRRFTSIPTGLFVAGFLANAGLLRVDAMIQESLKTSKIAHFRYVDDHIFIAYEFEELTKWVDQYLTILKSENTGASVNRNKIEPRELATYMTARQKREGRKLDAVHKSAKSATALDPRFPSPLMTKTLALVSRIGKTDFGLLEEQELSALMNQLEHLLLVDIPETELPEKTRLAFSATRLAQLAEQRLSNDSEILSLEEALERKKTEMAPQAEVEALGVILRATRTKASQEAIRVFSLLRKVLHDKPDRVRLWTRAVQLCRQIGVRGIADILRDISAVRNKQRNELAADYLLANTLALIGTNALVAAQQLVDPEVPEWRKRAAKAFLSDVQANSVRLPSPDSVAWYVLESWRQYRFGLLCAELVLAEGSPQSEEPISFSNDVDGDICQVLANSGGATRSAGLVWWATRKTLHDLECDAKPWVLRLGEALPVSGEALRFWTFFPREAPEAVLVRMLEVRDRIKKGSEGWWFEALKAKRGSGESDQLWKHKNIPKSVVRNIRRGYVKASDTIPLVEWCETLHALSRADPDDPRLGEWTALEVVRQIASEASRPSMFSLAYVNDPDKARRRWRSLHPANFRIPRVWLEEVPKSWHEWTARAREFRVQPVDLRDVIHDSRYAPLTYSWNSQTINPVRALGLILYGLLRCDFKLPVAWNGPGHSDVLTFLPRLLLHDVCCSSNTLGVLQGCLQPRAIENLSLDRKLEFYHHLDDDTAHDPFHFYGEIDVARAISLCQRALEARQLSTLNRHTRQLTPVSIRALSSPNWKEVFSGPEPPSGQEQEVL